MKEHMSVPKIDKIYVFLLLVLCFPEFIIDAFIKIYNFATGVALEGFDNSSQRAWLERIVRIEVTENVSGRAVETFSDCIVQPSILLGYERFNPVAVFLNDFYRVVGRASVNDDVFDLDILLMQHRLDGGPQRQSAVQNWRNDRDFEPPRLARFRQDSRYKTRQFVVLVLEQEVSDSVSAAIQQKPIAGSR
ncbi:hypothetical protein JCM16408A_46790 [Methylobacterium phyllosphaerae]